MLNKYYCWHPCGPARAFRLNETYTFSKSERFVETNGVGPDRALLLARSFFGLPRLIFGDPYRTFGLSVSKTHYVFSIEVTIPHENQCFCDKIL